MRLFYNVLLLCVAITYSLLAQNADSSLISSTPDSKFDIKSAQKTNSLSINPLGALSGSVSGSYEHLFIPRHGLLIEGGYAFGSGYDITSSYRYHYFTEKDENGLISPFWGFFIHKGKHSHTYEDTDTKKNYDFTIDLLTIGVHWGQRIAWGGLFHYAWRIGYGYPVVFDFNWPNGKPGNSNVFEGLAKVFSGIDAELSVGIVF